MRALVISWQNSVRCLRQRRDMLWLVSFLKINHLLKAVDFYLNSTESSVVHFDLPTNQPHLFLHDSPYLFFRKSGDPQHCSSPPAMMAMRSPSRSASSMKCVVSRMVRPRFSPCRRSQVARLADGSMPDVGSSNITTWRQSDTVGLVSRTDRGMKGDYCLWNSSPWSLRWGRYQWRVFSSYHLRGSWSERAACPRGSGCGWFCRPRLESCFWKSLLTDGEVKR